MQAEPAVKQVTQPTATMNGVSVSLALVRGLEGLGRALEVHASQSETTGICACSQRYHAPSCPTIPDRLHIENQACVRKEADVSPGVGAESPRLVLLVLLQYSSYPEARPLIGRGPQVENHKSRTSLLLHRTSMSTYILQYPAIDTEGNEHSRVQYEGPSKASLSATAVSILPWLLSNSPRTQPVLIPTIPALTDYSPAARPLLLYILLQMAPR